MHTFALIVACLGLGVALRASGRLPEGAHLTLNAVIVNISLPALTFASLRSIPLDFSLGLAAAMPWVVFAFGALFFAVAARLMRLSRATTGGLVLTGGLGNTSFVGLPLIETFFGRESMRVGLVIDQLGSYLVLSTVGVLAAGLFAGARPTPRDLAGRVLRFPPLIALVAALACRGLPLPAWLDAMLMRLGDTIAPLALLSVGFQLHWGELAAHWRTLTLGLGFKLLLVPFLIAPLYLGLLPESMHAVSRITIFESAMAPMIGAGIVAMQYRLNAPLVSLMLGVGIPLSLLTVPGSFWLLRPAG